jgi:hypothetical protein
MTILHPNYSFGVRNTVKFRDGPAAVTGDVGAKAYAGHSFQGEGLHKRVIQKSEDVPEDRQESEGKGFWLTKTGLPGLFFVACCLLPGSTTIETTIRTMMKIDEDRDNDRDNDKGAQG